MLSNTLQRSRNSVALIGRNTVGILFTRYWWVNAFYFLKSMMRPWVFAVTDAFNEVLLILMNLLVVLALKMLQQSGEDNFLEHFCDGRSYCYLANFAYVRELFLCFYSINVHEVVKYGCIFAFLIDCVKVALSFCRSCRLLICFIWVSFSLSTRQLFCQGSLLQHLFRQDLCFLSSVLEFCSCGNQ